ncbi:MAG: YggS family pyridoxal phosphate-dependent enzyme [Acidimicrobiales bacterium]
MSDLTVDDIRRRRDALDERILAAGGDPDTVDILAVTKTFPADVARTAVAAGLEQLGENYAQEVLEKAPLVDGASWHFIGGLQRNKVRKIAPWISLWQTVDRVDLALEIAKRAPGARVLIQMNTTGEPQKSGCEPRELDALVDAAVAAGLDVVGLMTVGPTGGGDPQPGFALLRSHVDRLGLRVCSMGMSGDLEAAVAEGSTMVRVGTALFGPRPPRAAE